jgi:hypothetical protein
MAAQKRLIKLNAVEICEDKRPIAKIKIIIPNKTISSLYFCQGHAGDSLE